MQPDQTTVHLSEAAEMAYESMYGLYRPWSRLEKKKKAGWFKAIETASLFLATYYEDKGAEKLKRVEAELDEYRELAEELGNLAPSVGGEKTFVHQLANDALRLLAADTHTTSNPPEDSAASWLERSLDRAHSNVQERPDYLKPRRYRDALAAAEEKGRSEERERLLGDKFLRAVDDWLGEHVYGEDDMPVLEDYRQAFEAAAGEESKDGQRAKLERALRRQHIEAHGSTCECRAFDVDLIIADLPGKPQCQPEDERESTEEASTVLVTLTADEAQAILSPNRYMDTVRGGRQHSLAERAKAKISTAMECAPPFDPDEFEREKASILRWLEQFAPATQSEQSHTEEGK